MPKRQVKKKKELEELLDDVVAGFLALVELGSRFQKDLKRAEKRVGEFKELKSLKSLKSSLSSLSS